MKRITLFLVLLISLLACKTTLKPEGFTVSGTVKNGNSKDLVFSKLTVGKVVPLDTVKLDDKGRFTFSGHTSMPEFYILSISQSEYINLLIDSMQQVVVNADASKFADNYTVEGSNDSKLLKELYDQLSISVHKIDSLGIVFQANQNGKNTDSLTADINPKMINVVLTLKKFTMSFIERNPQSLSTLIALSLSVIPQTPILTLAEDMPYYEMVDKNLSEKYPDSEAVKSLHTYLEQAKQKATMQGFVSIGQDAPEINLPTPEGSRLKLSSFRGNYVLLDFWASWCGPCRSENPNLTVNFAKYKSKGFKIYQVSLDKDPSAWRKAILTDKLTWSHVSDMKYWNSAPAQQYGVQSIPANFLIDPQGKVVAVDLRGEQLGQALAKIYGF